MFRPGLFRGDLVVDTLSTPNTAAVDRVVLCRFRAVLHHRAARLGPRFRPITEFDAPTTEDIPDVRRVSSSGTSADAMRSP